MAPNVYNFIALIVGERLISVVLIFRNAKKRTLVEFGSDFFLWIS